jgi:hypothetical protein
MSNLLKIKRGTRAQLNAAVSGNSLNLAEPYLITDEGRIAVGTGSNTYVDFAKASEAVLDADLTAIADLTGTGILRRIGENTWSLDTSVYLTAESDTLGTVTSRGATTNIPVNFLGGAVVGSTGLTVNGGTSGTVTLVSPAVAGTTNVTLPSASGTLALTSQLPTVNDGTLAFSISATPASSGTALSVGTGTGFSANTSSNSTYDVRVGPALSNLATFMGNATSGFIRRTGIDTYDLDTNTYLIGNQTVTLSGDASGSGATAITVTLASVGTAGTYTKVTTDAKGRVTAGTTLSATDIPTLTSSKISDFDAQVRSSRLDQMSAPTAPVSLNNQLITGLADPVSAQDAATKSYVDAVAQGIDAKDSVRAATTTNITLSGTQTIDGVALVSGDRILVKNQNTASQNGIYVVATGAWTRSVDADIWNELISAFTFVEEGTANSDTGWVSTVDAGGTLGVTSVTFVQFSGAGSFLAGDGLTLAGNVFNVGGTANRITVSADAVDIASTYVGQTSITTLGTITTGVWNGTAIAVTHGGLGLTSALNGLVKGNGTGYSAAVAGTDYLDPNSLIDGGTF